MDGMIMDMPLQISAAMSHAAEFHGSTAIVARTVEGGLHRYTYREAHGRMRQLAHALARLGVKAGDRVGSLAWNTHRHFEMFYGVSGTGAVLHTVNPRLFPEQIVYIVNHAEDACLFVDAATLPIVAQIAPRLTSVRAYVLMTDAAHMPKPGALKNLLCYDELLAAERDDYAWPEFDEKTASTICYTSGTTGDPKGVVYSHRSAILTSLLVSQFTALGSRNGQREVLMPMAPMFHGNAWQFPYVAPMTGSKLVLPGRNYEPELLYELIEEEQVTVTCGVPTMWLLLTDWLERNGKKFSTLRAALSSGSAAPRSLIDKLASVYGVELMQAWGMTEALGGSNATLKPGDGARPADERLERRAKSGRGLCGVKYRLLDDLGNELPHDGTAAGHLRIKAPWISSGYFKAGAGSALDPDGWMVTGDIATIDPEGYIALTDRSKDVIKSGGEWISSLQLENVAVAHPEVLQAAVIGVEHPKWQERPLLIVVRKQGSRVDARALLEFMRGKVAAWWLPDDVQFVDQFPMTGTGKVHKATLRQQFKGYRLPEPGAAEAAPKSPAARPRTAT